MSTLKTDEKNNIKISNNTFEIINGKAGTLMTAGHYARTLRGEMMHDVESGVRFFETAFDAPRLQLLRADITERIKQTPNVQSVERMDVVKVADGISYTANIRTTFGEGVIDGTL